MDPKFPELQSVQRGDSDVDVRLSSCCDLRDSGTGSKGEKLAVLRITMKRLSVCVWAADSDFKGISKQGVIDGCSGLQSHLPANGDVNREV